MTLLELQPRWIELANWAAKDPFYVGVSFLCPHCGTQRLCAFFDPPIDPAGLAGRTFEWPPNATSGLYATDNLCRREGDSFDDLTLIPPQGYLQWQGHGGVVITDGEVKQCV